LRRYRRQDRKIEDDIVSEMFLRGVSTIKVGKPSKKMAGKVCKLLWGSDVSASEVSRMNPHQAEVKLACLRGRKELIRWFNRPITKEMAYLIIDGAYFKVRRRRVGTEAMLCAVSITEDCHMEHLWFIQGHRESQEAWEFLLTHLVRRGLDPTKIPMVVSDEYPGILAAIRTVFPYNDHQRCLFHTGVSGIIFSNHRKPCPNKHLRQSVL
jgi:transposase-like protein